MPMKPKVASWSCPMNPKKRGEVPLEDGERVAVDRVFDQADAAHRQQHPGCNARLKIGFPDKKQA